MQSLVEIEEQLWQYIDNNCDKEQRVRISQLIANDPLWHDTYNSLLAIQSELVAIETEQPSLRFTKNVMESIETIAIAPKASRYINHKAIRWIVFACTAVVLALFTTAIVSTDWKIPVITYSKYIAVLSNPIVLNAALFSITILLLILIDSSLNSRRQKHARL